MTSTKPLTISERHARLMLTAWNSREPAELQTVLKRVLAAGSEDLPAAEHERMDLIQDLGRRLLIWKSSGPRKDAPSLNAALALVRHLARCERHTVGAGGGATSKPTLRFGMPAFVPRSRYVH